MNIKVHNPPAISMPQPIPSYLFALAVGDMTFRPLGPRTGVYAEPGLAEEASFAYKDVEQVVNVCHGAGISRKVARTRPIAVVKG